MKIYVINGPNLNLLGIREPEHYGKESYKDLLSLCESTAMERGYECKCFQSNHEGVLVDLIQEALREGAAGIVINPAAYTHTSIALLDAVKAVGLPTVEVHISKVNEREPFRKTSYIRAACIATVCGEGIRGYAHAINTLIDYCEGKNEA
jgi:3-dehydroquinate dehydratase-2